MQGVHITCLPERLLLLIEEIEAQCTAGLIVDWGHSCKRGEGYIVLEGSDEERVESFVARLDADERVVDYCVYSVSECGDLPF